MQPQREWTGKCGGLPGCTRPTAKWAKLHGKKRLERRTVEFLGQRVEVCSACRRRFERYGQFAGPDVVRHGGKPIVNIRLERQVADAMRIGMSKAAIARAYGLTWPQVDRWCRKIEGKIPSFKIG